MDTGTVRVLGLAAGLVAVGYVVYKVTGLGDSVAKGLGSVGESIANGAGVVSDYISNGAGVVAGVVDTGVSAPVYAIGDALGLPRTTETECERAKREGRTWDASFACPAGDFLSYLIKPGTGAGLPQASYDETERLSKRFPGPVPETAGSYAGGQYDAAGNFIGIL